MGKQWTFGDEAVIGQSIRLESPDDIDLTAFSPAGGTAWELPLEVFIDEEQFQVTACSIEWVAERIVDFPAYLTGRRLVVASFSLELIEQAIRRAIAHYGEEDSSWTNLRRSLNWDMQSEYEIVDPEALPDFNRIR
jgi:hypothetical protein